ncbi:helix-turn-helix domain-containing protein [Actinoplanes sp. NPDC026623]|uniref:helix-turn-helix domain-containing protein n=1 Tax=Actinoplanes sp. NPDC026623 TaxID=3155610 RepID=UPI0034036821
MPVTTGIFRNLVEVSDDVFLAPANRIRGRLLRLLAEGPRTAGDLADHFDLSRPAMAEHLQVLALTGSLIPGSSAGTGRGCRWRR